MESDLGSLYVAHDKTFTIGPLKPDDLLSLQRAAYRAGFAATCCSYNEEHPFNDYAIDPECDRRWVAERDDAPMVIVETFAAQRR